MDKHWRKKKWWQNLKKLDESEAFPHLLKSKTELLKKLLKQSKHYNTYETEQWLMQEYNNIEIDFEGWPITLSKIEVGVRTPEFVARTLYGKRHNDWRKYIEKIRADWRKDEVKRYGCVATLDVAKIDKERILFVKNHHLIGEDFGSFLGVRMEKKSKWPLTKFDIKIKEFENGYLAGEELYDFVDDLIDISQIWDIGVEVKPLRCSKANRLFMKNLYLYPRVEKDLPKDEILNTLEGIYDTGKEPWGNLFDVNPRDSLPELRKRITKRKKKT